MNEKFYSLKKEKQDTMINGAMEVVAKSGYRHASTDEMVKVCGVSKGLWFHYFENKTGLYSFVASYALKYAMLEFNMRTIKEGMDYFDVRYDMEVCKTIMMNKYPYLPLFLISLAKEDDEDVADTLKDPLARYREDMSELMQAADYGKLLDHEDHVLLTDMVDNTIDALMTEGYRSVTFPKERYLDSVRKHLRALKKLL